MIPPLPAAPGASSRRDGPARAWSIEGHESMYSAHGRILALTLAAMAMATGTAGASSISGATTTPTSTSATPVVTTLSTDFSTGTFDGWAVTDHTAGYGVAKDGTTVGGTYDVFGTMKVNAQKGDMAAYAVV